MTKSFKFARFAIVVAVISLFSACATDEQVKKPSTQPPKPVVVEPPKPVQPPPESPEEIREKAARAAAQSELDSIVSLYNNGDYQGEIKRYTGSADTLKPYLDLQLMGLKYTAFSYCVSGRNVLCRQQFEKALKLDPTFDLLPGEKGHPLWGPVFERVKKKLGK